MNSRLSLNCPEKATWSRSDKNICWQVVAVCFGPVALTILLGLAIDPVNLVNSLSAAISPISLSEIFKIMVFSVAEILFCLLIF